MSARIAAQQERQHSRSELFRVRLSILTPRPAVSVRIGSFGFLANRVSHEQLARCRQLLRVPEPAAAATIGETASQSVPGDDSLCCPYCGQGVMELVSQTSRPRASQLVTCTYQPLLFDSS